LREYFTLAGNILEQKAPREKSCDIFLRLSNRAALGKAKSQCL